MTIKVINNYLACLKPSFPQSVKRESRVFYKALDSGLSLSPKVVIGETAGMTV